MPLAMAAIGAVVLLTGAALLVRANASVESSSLASKPVPVSTVTAAPARYQATRQYVGTFAPWLEAHVGPQYLSAYVKTVTVRPGTPVHTGEVLATLDCQNAAAETRQAASLADALAAQQRALADEVERMRTLADGGFLSQNELETRASASASEQAKLSAARSKLQGSQLFVNDCVLRAPFDGEIAGRAVDPGTFVHPGQMVVSVIDRSVVRFTADVPELDFDAVAPGVPLEVRALHGGPKLTGTISRRNPQADAATRTVHVEADFPDPGRVLPVGTTAVADLAVGKPADAARLPLAAVSVHADQARLFVVEKGVAHRRAARVLGEAGGAIYLEPGLSGAQVVLEGRNQLEDGEPVAAQPSSPLSASARPEARGGGYPRPQ